MTQTRKRQVQLQCKRCFKTTDSKTTKANNLRLTLQRDQKQEMPVSKEAAKSSNLKIDNNLKAASINVRGLSQMTYILHKEAWHIYTQ